MGFKDDLARNGAELDSTTRGLDKQNNGALESRTSQLKHWMMLNESLGFQPKHFLFGLANEASLCQTSDKKNKHGGNCATRLAHQSEGFQR